MNTLDRVLEIYKFHTNIGEVTQMLPRNPVYECPKTAIAQSKGSQKNIKLTSQSFYNRCRRKDIKLQMSDTIHNITVQTIIGEDKLLKDYAGNVLLIVNLASYCGYTRQYAGLEQLHQTYKDSGLRVLGFPCNDYGAQEPGTNEEIVQFLHQKLTG